MKERSGSGGSHTAQADLVRPIPHNNWHAVAGAFVDCHAAQAHQKSHGASRSGFQFANRVWRPFLNHHNQKADMRRRLKTAISRYEDFLNRTCVVSIILVQG